MNPGQKKTTKGLSSRNYDFYNSLNIADSLKTKKLQIVLEEYEEKDFDIFAVYQPTKHLSARIRTLIDHLSENLKQP